MTDTARCRTGDWVEVAYVLLEPLDRSVALPPETASQPLRVWVKGFARAEAAIGEALEIETMTGRVVSGRLTDIDPGYTHTFGRPAPGLTRVGADVRARVAAYRAAAAADGSAAAPSGGE